MPANTEYKFVDGDPLKDLSSTLNNLAREGWRVVAMAQRRGDYLVVLLSKTTE